MRFIVKRTSQHGDESTAPCPGATLMEMLYHDRRDAARPEDVPFYRASGTEEWYAQGINHRVVDGCIVRDLPDKEWVLWIPDLSALLDMAREQGELAISTQDRYDYPVIEIVDDYRE